MQKKQENNLTNLIAYALIGAIAFVVMKFEFPIIPGIEFLKFDFSDAVITIGTFLFGIGPGIIITLIRSLLSLIFTGFALPSLVGQLAAFLASLSFAIPFYLCAKSVTKENCHTKKSIFLPVLGLIIGIIAMTIILALANAWLITPVYAVTSIPNMPKIASYQDLYQFTINSYLKQLFHIPSMKTYIFGIIVPFNLVKGLINAIVVYVLFAATLKNIKPFVQRKFNN